MEAKCPNGDTYYFYLERWEIEVETQPRALCKQLSGSSKTHMHTSICGTQWRALCVGYGIETDDVVKFMYDEKQHVFYIEVTDGNNATKPFGQYSGMLVSSIFLTH